MADRVELQFRRDAERLIPRGATVMAAVSGGGDSVALVHLLARNARSFDFELSVGHLDHGLRTGSRADRRFVEKLAGTLGLPCRADRREVATLRRRDESPEEAARRVRREFLVEAARDVGAEWIATGHTLDDQAETVLMRLARGAGPTALAGIAEAGPGPFVRPLLGLEGAELRGWLARRGLAYRDDPTNRSMRFDRNRVRHRVLPALTEQLNPRAARHLVKAAESLRDDARCLDALAARLARDLVKPRRDGGVSIDAVGLADADPALGRRVARTALIEAGADARRVASRHIVALLALARPGDEPREIHLPGRRVARRHGRRIVVGRPKP